MDGSYWGEIFRDAARISRAWAAEQARTEAILAALLEFHSRLVQLGPWIPRVRPEPYGALLRAEPNSDGLGCISELRARHERGRSNLLRALQESVNKFSIFQQDFAQLHGRVYDRYNKLSHMLRFDESVVLSAEVSETIVGAGRGIKAGKILFPPAPEAVRWVKEVDIAFTKELELKLRLLDILTTNDAGPNSLSQLSRAARIWCLQPGIEREAVERLPYLVESLTVE